MVLFKNTRGVLFEDLINSGGSVLKGLRSLSEMGIAVKSVVVLLTMNF